MANQKITDLTAGTTPIDADVMPYVDSTGPTTKKVTWANVKATLNTYFATIFAPKASPTFTGTVTLPTGLTGVVRADSGVVSIDSDVTDVVAAATSSAAGKVELAIASEINTGTDTSRAIPIDQFVASNRNIRYFDIRVIEATTDWSANGTTAVGGDFRSPFAGTMVSISAWSDTAGTTGTATVDVNKNGTTIMGTNKLNWDSTEKSTATYSGTAAALSVTSLAAEDIITVDIDTNHTTKSKGLTVRIGVRMT